MLGIILSVLSMILYMCETGIHIHYALNRYYKDLTSFYIIISLIAAPLVIVNIISTILVLRTMDFTGRGCARTICILLHVSQIGLLWRCLKLILLFDEHDWKEFIILRLIHTGLQSIPIVILTGSYFFNGSNTTLEMFMLIVIAVIANGVVFSMFNTEKYLFESDEFSEFRIRIRKPFGVIILTFGTIFVLFSRFGSIMLLSSVIPLWLPLPLGLHFIVQYISTTVYHFYKQKGSISQILKNLCYSYLNIFDILNRDNQKIACHNVLYYSFIIVQNVIMTGYWMMASDWNYNYKLGTVVTVILTFVCGIFLKSCSCGYLQEEALEPFSDATYQLALEIAMKNPSQVIGIKTEIQNHEQYGDHINHCSIISLENGYIHKVSQTSNKKITKSSEKGDSTPSRSKSRHKSNSNLDIASSNSRNTNTLNVSDPKSMSKDQHNKNNHRLGRLKNAQTMPCISSRKRPELTVRSSCRNVQPKRSFCKSPPKQKKIPLPLYPNECSDFISNKTFDSKHVLSNSVDKYKTRVSETDTSDSVSYTYYVTSSDWSSLSYDSNSACTWPPSNPMTFVNLHCLPKEKVSATESVQFWISQIEGWDGLDDNASFELTSHNEDCSTVHSENSRKSSSANKRDTKNSDFNTLQNKDVLLRPTDALLQLNDLKLSYLPYDKSDYDKTKQLSNDKTLVIWHEETTSSSTIQESMV